MRLRQGSAMVRILHELYTAPATGLSSRELAARLDIGSQTARNKLGDLVRAELVDPIRRQDGRNPAEDRVFFKLSADGYLKVTGRTMPPPSAEPAPDITPKRPEPMTPLPSIERVKRFVPNSVFALGAMMSRDAG